MNRGARIVAVIVVGVIVGLVRYSMRDSSSGRSPPGRSDIVNVDQDDARMEDAIAEAKKHWPDFVAEWGRKTPEQIFAVKLAFKVRGGDGSEHMWVRVDSFNGRTVSGKLMDRPYGAVGKKQGDRANAAVDDVEDWLVKEADGTLKGGYTQKVLDDLGGHWK
jgi:uncharacterized protein YegJ (DUF2314 family)